MRLIGLAVVLALSLLLTPFVAETQQTGKVYKVGILWLGRERPEPPSLGVFGQNPPGRTLTAWRLHPQNRFHTMPRGKQPLVFGQRIHGCSEAAFVLRGYRIQTNGAERAA